MPQLSFRAIQSLSRRRLLTLAKRHTIDTHGKDVGWIERKVYEALNNLLPGDEPSEKIGVLSARRMIPPANTGDEEEPDTDTDEQEMRNRLFLLVVEWLGDDLQHMTTEELDRRMAWCPVLDNGQRADCYSCPAHVLRRCFQRHRTLLE